MTGSLTERTSIGCDASVPGADLCRPGRTPPHRRAPDRRSHRGRAEAASDGIAFTGDAFGSAAYLAELLPIYVHRALTQIATSPARR